MGHKTEWMWHLMRLELIREGLQTITPQEVPKRFQVLLLNSNYSIQHNSVIFIQSNGSMYCDVIQIIQFIAVYH